MTVTLLLLLQAAASAGAAPPRALPFGVGERFEYSAKIGILSLGSAALEVAGIDTVRGQPAWNFTSSLNGGGALFKISSRLASWTSVEDFTSLRFESTSKENSKEYARSYEIFADSGFYRQRGVEGTQPTPREPLDEASFLYFIRTVELAVGKTYTFPRYFRPDKGTIVIKVLKRETMELPDGSKVACLVLNPVVGDKGTFARRNDARLWITDDFRRIPVQIRSRYPFGTITLHLEKMNLVAGT